MEVALRLIRKLPPDKRPADPSVCRILRMESQAYRLLGEAKNATTVLHEALKLVDSKEVEAGILLELARTYHAASDTARANQWYARLLELAKEPRFQIPAHYGKGEILHEQERIEEAETLLKLAHQEAVDSGCKMYEVETLSELGRIAADVHKDRRKSQMLFHQVLAIGKETGQQSFRDYLDSSCRIARYEAEQRNLQAALSVLDDAVEHSVKVMPRDSYTVEPFLCRALIRSLKGDFSGGKADQKRATTIDTQSRTQFVSERWMNTCPPAPLSWNGSKFEKCKCCTNLIG